MRTRLREGKYIERGKNVMKKFDLPLWADTLFICSIAFLFFFCIFRFYIGALWAAILCSLAAAGAATFLLHVLIRRRHRKKYTARQNKLEIQKLSFHLAMDAPAHNAERFAAALAAESGKDAKIEGERILVGGREYFLRFHLEPATADELATVIRRGGGEKTVFASAFTKEAEALALSFGIELMDAEKSYALLQENDCLPENYIMGSQIKRSLKNGLRLRLARKSWKGYLLAGVSLLLFSLISIFPVYYIVAGGLLLAAAVLVRIFGKV